MASTFEDMVKAIDAASSPFQLAGDLPVFRDGLNDLQNRLHALEATKKSALVVHPLPGDA